MSDVDHIEQVVHGHKIGPADHVIKSSDREEDVREALVDAFDNAWDDERYPPDLTEIIERQNAVILALAGEFITPIENLVLSIEDSDTLIGIDPHGPITNLTIAQIVETGRKAVEATRAAEEQLEELEYSEPAGQA